MRCSHCRRDVQARDLMYCVCGAGLCRRCRVFWKIEMKLGRCPACEKGGKMTIKNESASEVK